MKTLLHISDLHFGRIEAATLEPLLNVANAVGPDVVVVSGDLTQRARRGQFRDARAFLDRLPGARVVVPGNHDVPLYNVVARFLAPFANYRRYISEDLEPFYADDEVAIAPISTAYSRTVIGGRVTRRQIARVRERLERVPANATRFVVTHHPLDMPDAYHDRTLARRARQTMEALVECEADVLLSGHLHASHAGPTTERHQIAGHVALMIHAGTATSSRRRREANSFNVIRVERPRIEVERYVFDEARAEFVVADTSAFVHSTRGWGPVVPEG